MIKKTLLLTLMLLGCGNNYLDLPNTDHLFDTHNQSVCGRVADYCLPLEGDLLFTSSNCKDVAAGKTRDGSISKYVSRGSTGYFDFYELGFSKVLDGDMFFKEELKDNQYKCVPVEIKNDLTYREVVSTFENGDRFKLKNSN